METRKNILTWHKICFFQILYGLETFNALFMKMVEGEESGEKHPQWFATPQMNEQMMLSPAICLILMAVAVL